jgi:hypothetical protein
MYSSVGLTWNSAKATFSVPHAGPSSSPLSLRRRAISPATRVRLAMKALNSEKSATHLMVRCSSSMKIIMQLRPSELTPRWNFSRLAVGMSMSVSIVRGNNGRGLTTFPGLAPRRRCGKRESP